MDNYKHMMKVNHDIVVELLQTYLEGYAQIWYWKMLDKKWENAWLLVKGGLEERIKVIHKNFNYLPRCILQDLVNGNNDNLWQYVKTYTEFMLKLGKLEPKVREISISFSKENLLNMNFYVY
jgi:hypothetical protein